MKQLILDIGMALREAITVFRRRRAIRANVRRMNETCPF